MRKTEGVIRHSKKNGWGVETLDGFKTFKELVEDFEFHEVILITSENEYSSLYHDKET